MHSASFVTCTALVLVAAAAGLPRVQSAAAPTIGECSLNSNFPGEHVTGVQLPAVPSSCGEVREADTLSLTCGDVPITAIAFASFGVPTGSCAGGFAKSACDANTTLAVVEKACVGQKTCSIFASPSVFGDPCYDVLKRLAVAVNCSAAPLADSAQPPPLRFRWTLEAPARGAAQESFELQVLPSAGSSVLWSSGVVASAEPSYAVDSGVLVAAGLRSGAAYAWRVRANVSAPAVVGSPRGATTAFCNGTFEAAPAADVFPGPVSGPALWIGGGGLLRAKTPLQVSERVSE
jgi:hypothetical protein